MSQAIRSPLTIGLIVLIIVLIGAVGYLASYPPTKTVTTTVQLQEVLPHR